MRNTMDERVHDGLQDLECDHQRMAQGAARHAVSTET
jgi:hypothetical protein